MGCEKVKKITSAKKHGNLRCHKSLIMSRKYLHFSLKKVSKLDPNVRIAVENVCIRKGLMSNMPKRPLATTGNVRFNNCNKIVFIAFS